MSCRVLTILCFLYLGVLVYASLMPFDFVADEAQVAARFEQMWLHWPFVFNARVSRSDALSNLLLYIPLGVLVATRCRLVNWFPSLLPLIAAASLAGVTSGTVEVLQAYSITRTPSILDWLLNVSGGVVGAIVGTIWGRPTWIGLIRWLRVRCYQRPVTVAAAALLLLLAADALAPFMPTILLKDVWRNLRLSHFSLLSGTALHPWHWWFVVRVGVFAALTALLAASSVGRPWVRWSRAAVLACCFAVGLEICKPLITARQFNIANIAFSACGCSLALVAGPLLAKRLTESMKLNLGILALGSYITYLEWRPFSLSFDAAMITSQIPRGVQWLPLYHYAMGASLEHVRLFVNTIILSCGLVCMVRLKWSWMDRGSGPRRIIKAAALSGAFGLVLELGQFCLPRLPSTTDVFCFALGGALGAWVRLPRASSHERQIDT